MSLNESQIKQVEKDLNYLHSEVMRLFLLKDKSDLARDQWLSACKEWHSYKAATSFLWSKEFQARIKGNDEVAISEAILYLEVDPYFFRSGYLKERLLSSLKSCELSKRDKVRILECFKDRLKFGLWRRDTRYYFSLVAKNFTEEFLESYLEECNPPNSRKLNYLKRYLAHYYASNKPL